MIKASAHPKSQGDHPPLYAATKIPFLTESLARGWMEAQGYTVPVQIVEVQSEDCPTLAKPEAV